MLSKESVTLRMGWLAAAHRRKIDVRQIEIYHRVLSQSLDEDQFANACERALEEDDKVPSIQRLLELGRGYKGRERGIPYVVDSRRGEIGPLGQVIADVDQGRPVQSDDAFRGRRGVKPHIERLVYEDAVATCPPVPDEHFTDRLRRIAEKAEAELARMEAADV